MKRTIITGSSDVLYIDGPVLINADNLNINKIVVSGRYNHAQKCFSYEEDALSELPSNNHKDYPLVELRGNNCRVGEISIFGGANKQTKASWINTVMSGLKITGGLNVVGRLYAESVHIPYVSTGFGNRLISLKAEYFSGDGFNLCADHSQIMKADLKAGLAVYPYDVYHRDIGMMYQSVKNDEGNLLTLDGCNVYNVTYTSSVHPWNDPRMQGILIDGESYSCNVYNLSVVGEIHPDHGVSYADAEGCEVMNIDTMSAINWDKKSECRSDRGNRCVGGLS